MASGHFDRRVELHQRDELGELAGEFNKMCDQLAAARDRLAAETTARIHTLELLRHADRLKTVGQLASGIAHELGTPLNVVRARAKMIVSDAASPSEAQSNARIVVEQSDRMARIIRQLLDFARPRAARRASADLRNVAARTAEMFSAMAAKQNVRIALDLGEIPLVAEVDADQIQQVQSNLVLNAIQAMPQGGEVTIELSAETAHPPESPPSVSIECLCLRVRDTGQGIRPEEIEHIFEPFFSTKQAGEGTGLGLSVSRGIIEEHGGWIGVTSTGGQGSCFQVFVPRRVADASSCADRG